MKWCGSNRLTPHGYREPIIFSSAKRCKTLSVKGSFSCSSLQVSSSTHAPSSMSCGKLNARKKKSVARYKPNLSNKAGRVVSCRDDLAANFAGQHFFHAVSRCIVHASIYKSRDLSQRHEVHFTAMHTYGRTADPLGRIPCGGERELVSSRRTCACGRKLTHLSSYKVAPTDGPACWSDLPSVHIAPLRSF